MINLLKKFADEEFGNAVIDWTVLVAGTMLLGIAVVITVTDNMHTVNDQTVKRVNEIEVNPS